MTTDFSSQVKRGVTLAAAAAALTCAMSANAIVYRGSWDPAFGAAFPDLGWNGVGEFYVPDACLAMSGVVYNSDPCSGGTMSILSADVGFYKLSDPDNPAYQETLSYTMPSMAVNSMTITDGALSGLDGTFLYSIASTLPIAGGPYTEFRLFFDEDVAGMFYISRPPGGPVTWGVSDYNPPDGKPLIIFTPVPEPGTTALMLAGLAAVGFIASRRRKK